jgi:hypothetical protein
MMRIRVLLALGLALLAAGCGSSGTETSATTAETTTAATTTAADLTLTIYHVGNSGLERTTTTVPQTKAVAAAALDALGVDAPVTITDGTATVQLDRATEEQVAEIVYTLTEFSTVERVNVAGRTGLTRKDFANFKPAITIESPASGDTVPTTFHVTGTASVFEAALVVQLVQNGKVVDTKPVTASEGAPARGTFETTLHGAAGAATVEAFASSAEDGSKQHQVSVSVTVSAG